MRKISILITTLCLFFLGNVTHAQIKGGGTFKGSGTITVSASTSPGISISLAPATATVVAGASQQFQALIQNDTNSVGATASLSCSGTGAQCGTLTGPVVIRNQTNFTYTAPLVIPSIPTVSITLVSNATSASFTAVVTALASQQGPPPNVSLYNFSNKIPFQTSALSNTFPFTRSQGSTILVGAATAPGNTWGATATDDIGNIYSTVCSFNQAGAGSIIVYGVLGAKPGAQTITITQTGPVSVTGIVVVDLGNGASFSANACSGSGVSTTSPTPTQISALAGGFVFSMLGGDTVTAANAPFLFQQFAGGNGLAYAPITTNGTYGPTWTTHSNSWAGANVAVAPGTSTGVISVALTPASASVQTGGTQVFTANVTNDTSHAGSTITLSGAGCAGATCGTLSSSHAAENGTVTYTGPGSVPSPATVTITETSVTDVTKVTTSTITVTGAAVLGVTVNPTVAATTAGGNTLQFTPTVTNDSAPTGTSITFTGTGCTGNGCGTISATTAASGVPITYTPPPTLSATISVTLTFASNNTPATKASATITVSPTTGPFICNGTCPAFPDAQGSGALSVGGRGGVVYNINTTSDGTNGGCVPNSNGVTTPSMTCSERDCVQASGARTCIYRTGGNTNFQSRMTISNPYITIAGQTAPGGGFWSTFPANLDAQWWVSTHDIIMRYIGCSAENSSLATGPSGGTGCFLFTNANNYNVILDHISMRWWGNKGLIFGSNGGGATHDVTLDWSLVYEPNAAHPVCLMFDDTDSEAASDTNQDSYKNVLISCDHRMPLWNTASGRWVNNLVYNYGTSNYAFLSQGGTKVDIINNKYVAGNIGGNSFLPLMFNTSQSGDSTGCPGGGCLSGNPSPYISGNIGPAQTDPNANQLNLTATGTEGGQNGTPIPSGWLRNTQLTQPTFPIAADPVTSLDTILLSIVGNSRTLACDGSWVSNRNSQDARVIASYPSGSGDFYRNQFSSPNLAPGTPCTETMNDGIPDAWKTRFGLSTSNPTLYKTVDTNRGNVLTYLEIYLAGPPYNVP